ncbi:MAG: Glu/Leu/Phe/Val dehydrogenase, partial [Alphaproteobacteria bacterium]
MRSGHATRGKDVTPFTASAFDAHEQVAFFHDQATGLRAIVAVHSTALGPGCGGVRMWPYASDDAALEDALKLSRAMSYKNAMAGLALGGGKAVILGDPRRDKSPALMRAFGRCVERMAGRYVTAEDVGMSVSDMQTIAQETRFVTGTAGNAASAGDPSPYTAHGVFAGIKAALAHRFGDAAVAGRTVAVQGLGNVGFHLAQELHAAGARLVVADIAADRVARAVDALGARSVGVNAILSVAADVLAPCALGGVINDQSVETIKAAIVAGGANNQLAADHHGRRLMERGILYAPDYVINAGGIMNCSLEYEGKFQSVAASMAWVESIADTLTAIFVAADREGRPTNEIADAMARA